MSLILRQGEGQRGGNIDGLKRNQTDGEGIVFNAIQFNLFNEVRNKEKEEKMLRKEV